jgi:hypothetical protein
MKPRWVCARCLRALPRTAYFDPFTSRRVLCEACWAEADDLLLAARMAWRRTFHQPTPKEEP